MHPGQTICKAILINEITLSGPIGYTNCSQLNGGCSNLCLPSPQGYQCFCPEGVELKLGDAYTCQGGTYEIILTIVKEVGILSMLTYFLRNIEINILSVI